MTKNQIFHLLFALCTHIVLQNDIYCFCSASNYKLYQNNDDTIKKKSKNFWLDYKLKKKNSEKILLKKVILIIQTLLNL